MFNTVKTRIQNLLIPLAILATVHQAIAQGTAFTYQGRLNVGTNQANGSYDLTFALFGASSGAGQVGNTVTNSATAVTNGLFAVPLDFGANFPGTNRWLEISVRTNGNGALVTLSPRQQLTPTPYAITAGNLSGTLPAGQFAGAYSNAVTMNNAANSFSGNGSGLAGVNAAQLGGLSKTNFWQTGGNSGTTAGANYLGTSDNQPLELRVNGSRALRLEPAATSPNFIGGYGGNSVVSNAIGATIGGGGQAGYLNVASTNFSVLGGGVDNFVGGDVATIGGGVDGDA